MEEKECEVEEKEHDVVRGKRIRREGRAGAQRSSRGSGCRYGVASVTGGKWEDPGYDPGGLGPGPLDGMSVKRMCFLYDRNIAQSGESSIS